MPNAEIHTLKKAASLAGVTHQAMREWCLKYGIGHQLENGRWVINKAGLQRLIKARAILSERVSNEPQ